MATAVCGLQSAGSKPAKLHREHRRKAKDSKRRQAALLFLTNISLDGRPPCQLNNGNTDQKAGEELRLRDGDGGATVVPQPAVGPRLVSQVTEPGTAGSDSGLQGVVSPYRPSLVMSPGPAGTNAVGANEVFLESCSLSETLTPDTPQSPLPAGHQPCSRVRSTPVALSPVPSGNTLDSRQRLRNVSGSPGPKVPKKVHFIKSMRQYDTRGCSDTKLEAQRQRLSSVVAVDLLPSLEGVELGAYGKTVSYAQFLYPTNALVRQKSSGGAPESCISQTPLTRFRGNGPRSFTPARLNNSLAQDMSAEETVEYDPNLLSDPQWPCGRHKRVLIFPSYVTTIVEYVKPSDLKKDMNETFREKFPHIKLTLSKIRSLKREMRAVSEEFGLQPVTTAMAFVYFEKLVLQGRLNKQNRKLVAAACVLLAAKISSDLRKPEVRQLIDKLEERFRLNRRELIPLEFPVLVALEMGLYLPESKVMPHYRRLVQQG
ncbi:CDK5 and ABL1 enzyme substrate 2-like isoform X2 [Halichoeres trimaculatus]|uniref:CDK5 and ABL1 enzyme substrate 2-like isoform X2 n=1 Tax=Halichoeres trimaculatus TaxID=147232 RepID=UPI003D9EF022